MARQPLALVPPCADTATCNLNTNTRQSCNVLLAAVKAVVSTHGCCMAVREMSHDVWCRRLILQPLHNNNKIRRPRCMMMIRVIVCLDMMMISVTVCHDRHSAQCKRSRVSVLRCLRTYATEPEGCKKHKAARQARPEGCKKRIIIRGARQQE